MANNKRPPVEADRAETPKDFPGVTPRDLYPTSDIRFVMVEVGKLSSAVERLIADVKSQGEKVDAMRHQITFVKGGLYVFAGVMAVATYLLSAKWDAILLAIKTFTK